MRVHIDTNILLDVIAKREPFWRHSSHVWDLAERGEIGGWISAISYNNCFYIVRKYGGQDAAFTAMTALRDVFRTVDLTAQVLAQAMDSGIPDFEDAIQFFSALHVGAEMLLTRNPDDFPRDPIPVLSPAEFLAATNRS